MTLEHLQQIAQQMACSAFTKDLPVTVAAELVRTAGTLHPRIQPDSRTTDPSGLGTQSAPTRPMTPADLRYIAYDTRDKNT